MHGGQRGGRQPLATQKGLLSLITAFIIIIFILIIVIISGKVYYYLENIFY